MDEITIEMEVRELSVEHVDLTGQWHWQLEDGTDVVVFTTNNGDPVVRFADESGERYFIMELTPFPGKVVKAVREKEGK